MSGAERAPGPESAPPSSGEPPESRRVLESNARLLIRAEHDLHKLEDRHRREGKKLAAVLATAWRLRDLPGDALFHETLTLFATELDHDRGVVFAPAGGSEYRPAASVGFDQADLQRRTEGLGSAEVERIDADAHAAAKLLGRIGIEQGLAGLLPHADGPLLLVVGRSERLAPFMDPLDGMDRRLFDLLLAHVAGQLENQALVARISAENRKLMAAQAAVHEKIAELEVTRRHVEQAGGAAVLAGFLDGLLSRFSEPLEAVLAELDTLKDGSSALVHAYETIAASHTRRVPTAFAEINALETRFDLARWVTELPKAAATARERIAAMRDLALVTGRITGAPDGEPGRVDVASVVSDALAVTGETLRARATLDLAIAAVPHVRADRGRICHVVLHLLANALEALPDRPAAANVIRVATQHDGTAVVIAVEDNGGGIDPGIEDQVFDPFFTTKTSRGATGLGLTVARRIVESHKGRIDFVRRPGSTRFEVALPAAQTSRPR